MKPFVQSHQVTQVAAKRWIERVNNNVLALANAGPACWIMLEPLIRSVTYICCKNLHLCNLLNWLIVMQGESKSSADDRSSIGSSIPMVRRMHSNPSTGSTKEPHPLDNDVHANRIWTGEISLTLVFFKVMTSSTWTDYFWPTPPITKQMYLKYGKNIKDTLSLRYIVSFIFQSQPLRPSKSPPTKH